MMKIARLYEKKDGILNEAEKLYLPKSEETAENEKYSGIRQISLIDENALIQIKQAKQKGLCMDRFYANIVVQGWPDSIRVGDTLTAGGIIIKINRLGKQCFPECILAKNDFLCPLQSCAFGQVIKDGNIRTGMCIRKF